MKKSLTLMVVVLFGFSFLTGCDSGSTKVIDPAGIEETEQDRANQAELDAAAEAPPTTTDPKKPSFTGN